MKKVSRFLLFFVMINIGVYGLTFLQNNANENKANGYSEVFVQGNYAYCVSSGVGIDIIEISNPASPIKKGNFGAIEDARGLYVSSSYAYISNGYYGIKIIDISNPSSPSFVGAYDPSPDWDEHVLDVFISGNYAYLADWYHGLQIVNISNPSSPSFVGSYDTPGQGISLHVSGNYVYIADGYGGLQILNIRNPSAPTVEGVFTQTSFVSDVFVKNNYAYIIDSDLRTYVLKIIDVTNPSSPTLTGTCTMPDIARNIYISGGYAYVPCGTHGLQIVSISQPSSPFIKDSYVTNGNVSGVYVKDYYAYIADESEGLIIINILDPSLPKIALNRTRLNYGANKSGLVTKDQTFFISNSGGGTLNWLITDNVKWLSYSKDSGQGSEIISLTADPTGLAIGTHHATIAVSDINAINSPQFIEITLKIFDSSATTEPFGSFATPIEGSIVQGSIPVTGWVLDDIEVESVKVYREGENSVLFIGDAIFVEGARPDIETAYPDYPMNYKAGWGYMMLTNFLPNGNGVFKIHAIATDKEGRTADLFTKTITVDNANAVKPFGAIDIPAPGGTAAGTNHRNQGWVLTPPPNRVPENGSTINVYVDGIYLGHPVYNIYRPDVATLFPGYINSNGAGAYFDIDTTAYENGIHSIFWTAADNAGNTDGIGSRYFVIQNGGCMSSGAGNLISPLERGGREDGVCFPALNHIDISSIHVDDAEPITLFTGYSETLEPQEIYPGAHGIIEIQIRELERVEIHWPGNREPDGNTDHAARPGLPLWRGFQVIGDRLRPLPVGSSLDSERGIFYWHPGPGFVGNYRFVFVEKKPNGDMSRKNLSIEILPKFEN